MKTNNQQINAARSNFFLVKDQSAFMLFLDENELELIYDTGNRNRVGFFTAKDGDNLASDDFGLDLALQLAPKQVAVVLIVTVDLIQTEFLAEFSVYNEQGLQAQFNNDYAFAQARKYGLMPDMADF